MPGNILIIDDSVKIREYIIQVLGKLELFDNYLEASDGIEGFKSLLTTKVDLVLCDLEMPRADGFRFLQFVNSRQELQGIPVILLTSRVDRHLKIKGLEQGASDYVTKPFDAGELVARVKVQLKIKNLQDDLKRSNDLLKELSNTDPLTGLYNRRFLTEVLAREIRRAERTEEPLCLVMLDIDHFKKVNDSFGHQNGDSVLSAIADLVKKGLRGYDVAVRYGGEEFVLLLPNMSWQEGFSVAERIRVSVQDLSFPAPMKNLRLTVSMGVACFSRERFTDMDSLLKEADEALYRAKQNGRNRVETAACLISIK